MDVDKKATPDQAKKAAPGTPGAGKQNKTPSGKVLERASNKRTLWKNAFDSPFTVRWDPIGPEAHQQVVGALSSFLKKMPSRTIPEGDGPTWKENFEDIVLGLNAVTRALEKNQLRLVICTRDLTPARALQHLPVLCAMKLVPLCPISMTSQSLAELFGEAEIRTVICMGFKRPIDEKNDERKEIVSLIASKCPILDIPWIPSQEAISSISSAVSNRIANNTEQRKGKGVVTKLQALRVRKIQHTAPIKPPKQPLKAQNQPKKQQSSAAKATSSAPVAKKT